MADIVASVPELTILIFSMEGTISMINSAISTSLLPGAPNEVELFTASKMAFSTSSLAWPKIIGPQELMRSI